MIATEINTELIYHSTFTFVDLVNDFEVFVFVASRLWSLVQYYIRLTTKPEKGYQW
jgi:hypothetical protein